MGKSEKIDKEREIYNQIFEKDNKNSEKTNRVLGLLRDCSVISSDVPDIIAINRNDKIAYGIEEFRVDHHIRNQHGTIGASSFKVKNDSGRLWNKYKDNIEDHYLDAANDINRIISREVEDMFNATYTDLLRSLDYSLEKHYKKIESYMNNSDFPNGFKKKMVFLVEIYSDFHNLYKCSYRRNEPNIRGLMPLTNDVIERFSNSKIYGVDYIILVLKSYLNDDVQIIALDTSDIEKSIKLNSVETYVYCGIDNYIKYSEDKVLSVEFNEAFSDRDTIKAYHRDNFHIQDNPYYLPAIFTAGKMAMEYRSLRKSYLIERTVLYFVEVYGKNIVGWNQSFDEGLVEPIFNKINQIDINRRVRKFDENYPFVGRKK